MDIVKLAVAISIIIHFSANVSAFGDGLIISREPLSNTLRYEEQDGQTIYKIPTIFNFRTTIVSKIIVDGKENNRFVSVRVEELNGVPTGTIDTMNAVYRYINGYANTIRINKFIFYFKVPLSWKLQPNHTVTLMIWDNGLWHELNTQKINDSFTDSFFEADTEHMGSFAIASIDRTPLPNPNETYKLLILPNISLNTTSTHIQQLAEIAPLFGKPEVTPSKITSGGMAIGGYKLTIERV